jgi:ribosome maturation factor RimP
MTASAARLRGLVAPEIALVGYDLEDLTVTAAGKRSVVRVVVDKDGGVTLDDVADVSRTIGDVLDRVDESDPGLLGASYVLEVSSPGVDRPLTQPRHWRRNVRRLVTATLREGAAVTGRVLSADDEAVLLTCPGSSSGWRTPTSCAAACRWSSDARTPWRTTPSRPPRRTSEDRHDRPARTGAREGDLVRPRRERDRDAPAHGVPAHRGRPAARARRARPQDRRGRRARQELAEDGTVAREYDDTPEGFGRIAASTAKQVILQRLREAESALSYGEYAGREGDVVSGIVQQAPQRPGAPPNRNVMVKLGTQEDALEAVLPPTEQVPGEVYAHGSRLKCRVISVARGQRGAQVTVSRTHPSWSRGCSPSRCPRSPTARWRSPRSPARPATGPRSPYGRRWQG